MTTLEITPKTADKTARFKGTVAAGEHVSVTIKGGASWIGDDAGANLTLRVLDLVTGRTLAVFPRPEETLGEGEVPDAWGSSGDDLTCTLNLNTDRMVAAARHMLCVPVMFVLGDTDSPRTLYFRDRCEVEYWPERIGDDTPYDLDKWPKKIDEWTELVTDWNRRMDAMKLSAQRVPRTGSSVGKVKITLNDGNAATDTVVEVFDGADGEVTPEQLNTAIAGVNANIGNVAADLDAHANNGDIHVTATQKSAWTAKYGKPSGGIPKSDLAAAVQASLGRADTALQAHQDISGKADLVGGKVPQSQLPSYVDDVLEYAAAANFPATGEEGKIYVAKDTNKTYRWSGTGYVQVGGRDIIVDSALSDTSENPVQNRAVKEAVDKKVSKTEAEAGFTKWVVTDPEGTVIPDESPTYENGFWELEEGGVDFTCRGTADAVELLLESAGGAIRLATRMKLRPTKTSELENDGSDGEHPYASRSEVEAGWWSGWTVTCGGVDVTSQVPQPERYASDLMGWSIPTEYPTVMLGDILYDETTGYGDDTLLLEWTSSAGAWSATRRRIVVPTKTSELTNDSGFLTEHQDITGKANVSDVPLLAAKEAVKLASAWTYSDPGLGADEIYTEPVWANGVWTIHLARYSAILGTFVQVSGTYTVQGQSDAATLTFSVEGVNIIFTRKSANVTELAHLSDISDTSGKEDVSNKVTSLSAQSTDAQYPSAKCVWDMVGDVESAIAAINGTENGGSGT